jgi:FkbM family methyltransferase
VPIAQIARAKGGVVHAFEVQRPLFHALCGTAALNDLNNLYIHHMGLGAAASVLRVPAIDYGVPQDFGLVSLVEQPGDDSGEAVSITSIDGLGLNRLDFLKVDVEGMDVDVLRGGRRMLEKFEPWAWVEYWKSDIEQIKQQFSGLRYRFYRADELNLLCAPVSRLEASVITINGVEI